MWVSSPTTKVDSAKTQKMKTFSIFGTTATKIYSIQNVVWKVRLLLLKLESSECMPYRDIILPQIPRHPTFREVVQ